MSMQQPRRVAILFDPIVTTGRRGVNVARTPEYCAQTPPETETGNPKREIEAQ